MGGFLSAFYAMLCFAYNMHPTYPMVFDELKPTSGWYTIGDRHGPQDISKWTQGALRKMDYATIASLFICFVTYMIVGAAGTLFCASKQVTRACCSHLPLPHTHTHTLAGVSCAHAYLAIRTTRSNL